jgi:hypothetical protein
MRFLMKTLQLKEWILMTVYQDYFMLFNLLKNILEEALNLIEKEFWLMLMNYIITDTKIDTLTEHFNFLLKKEILLATVEVLLVLFLD